MDALQKISYTHRFWVFLLPLVLMAADIVTGWILCQRHVGLNENAQSVAQEERRVADDTITYSSFIFVLLKIFEPSGIVRFFKLALPTASFDYASFKVWR